MRSTVNLSKSLMITILFIRWKMRSIRKLRRLKEEMISIKIMSLLNLISSQILKLSKMSLKRWILDLMLVRLSRTLLNNFNKRWIIQEESIESTLKDFLISIRLLRKKRSLSSYLKMLRIWSSTIWSLLLWNRKIFFQRKSLKNYYTRISVISLSLKFWPMRKSRTSWLGTRISHLS